MTQTLEQPTRTTPDYGVNTSHAPATTISRAPIPEGFGAGLYALAVAWLPAFVVLIGMPLLALATTKYVLLPSVKQAYASAADLPGESAAGQAPAVFLARIPYNASGAADAHSGIRGLTLVVSDSACKDKIDQNKSKLMALASKDLKGKTSSDLDKPGALDGIRARLRADFNRALRGTAVREVYIAEWPSR
jgi:hypothetical protein